MTLSFREYDFNKRRHKVDSLILDMLNEIIKLVTPYAASIMLGFDDDLGWMVKIATSNPKAVADLLQDEDYNVCIIGSNEVIVDLL
jgi:hypothetical protein